MDSRPDVLPFFIACAMFRTCAIDEFLLSLTAEVLEAFCFLVASSVVMVGMGTGIVMGM